MSVFVVTWDINKARANYSAARAAFISHLERYDHTKDSGLDSVWFISTSSSANDIDAFLRQKLDNNDRLIVSRMRAGEHQGWLDADVWKWINSKL